MSNGRITSLPACALNGPDLGRSVIWRTRLTSISTGTTSVGDPGEENRASAATSRPASALAGIPIVTPNLRLLELGKDRFLGPSTAKSP